MMAVSLFLLQAAEAAPKPFDWQEGMYVLLILMIVMGGLMGVEAVHRPGGRMPAKPRRARKSAPDALEGAAAPIDQSDLTWSERVWWGRAMLAGILGTGVMTVLLFLAATALPDLPKLDPAAMLASAMGDNATLGWIAHFMIGVVLAAVYALGFAAPLPGPMWARGAVFGLLPFFAAQLVVIPLMGGGFFSANMPQAGAAITLSLLGHLIYGAVVGGVYGTPPGDLAEDDLIEGYPEQDPER